MCLVFRAVTMAGLVQLLGDNVSWVEGDRDGTELDSLVQQYRDITNYESDDDYDEDGSPKSSNTQESVNRPLDLPESIPTSSWVEPILPLGMIRLVLKPLTKIWNREALTEAMPDKKKQIENIAFQYCGNLLYLVSNDNLPADAVSAFESILTHDLAFCKDAVPIASNTPELLTMKE
ncbi:hypothetical protein Ocin01_16486 [Orchesella cincta]|uniref:Uncharacterized protein n=1 Tax=Orchesella cincta TaxID=48709 RepID=A0A1D2MBD1_ORCCI|nr:hypothetical protein Ocin01_16486 [Orchesella cincta]